MAKLSQLNYVLVHRGRTGRPSIYELDPDFRQLETGLANLVAIIGCQLALKPYQ